MKRLTIIIMCIMPLVKALAFTDPTLAGMIVVYTDKAEKQLKSQGIASLTGMLTGTGDGEGKSGGLFSGIGNFFSAFTSGQGGNLFGEFFKNIGQGKVSLMSILGLMGAGWLIFGRFGWLGKIFGAILGMSILGGNVSLGNVLGQEKSQTPTLSAAEGIQQVNNPENQTAVIRRGR